jgi:transcriptional regulator with PAS, ATPase and Fis domain
VAFCGLERHLEALRQFLPGVRVTALLARDLGEQGRAFFEQISAVIVSLSPEDVPRRENLIVTGLTERPGVGKAWPLLEQLQDLDYGAPLIVLTFDGLPLDVACALVRLGVRSLIDADAADWQVQLAHTLRQLDLEDTPSPQKRSHNARELLELVGIKAVSPAMQALILQAQRAAEVSDATVLVQGESGTGKQKLAEAIHRLDAKRGKFPFVAVNCAAIAGSLAESELFGHSRGAFTGATESRTGYFRSANGGTILLDEISELPLGLQPKLLRVLQESRIMPVGSDKEEAIDVRIIAASNVPLQERVAKGLFRLDLYQRLNVIHLSVPPLRQRTEDIPLLVLHFMQKYAKWSMCKIVDIDPRVFEVLKRRLGDGNVRELENVVRQTLVFKTGGDRLELSDLPRYLMETDGTAKGEMIPAMMTDQLIGLIRDRRITLKQAMGMFEKTLITRTLEKCPEMSKVELAKALGLPRRTLYYKLDEQQERVAE